MNELVALLTGESVIDTLVRIIIFLAIAEFIGGIFALIGHIKG